MGQTMGQRKGQRNWRRLATRPGSGVSLARSFDWSDSVETLDEIGAQDERKLGPLPNERILGYLPFET